ncbi:asialoglycoprotein receptor 1-like [Rana temporaria]|uniref:asialoglycoprotein receptor 1-like n=1 Tax=Rana temporaria TaxID=8407 RepID=UPI001AADEBAA|nr:asialoglycoprotein receptor 1-like [Rana temporaria]
MRRIENLEMKPDQPCVENTYANMTDLDLRRMRKTQKAKETSAARSTKYRVILILGVLLILALLMLLILTGVLFNYYKNMEEITQLKANYTNMEEEITQLKANYSALKKEVSDLQKSDKNMEEEITQLKANYSALKKEVSDLQKSVANLTDDLNKIKLIKNKGSSDPTCSMGWLHYGLSCYYLSSSSKPWNIAKKECEDKEAHLVVINADREMNFLRGIAKKNNLWIGLTDADGTWRWVDGTPYDTTPKIEREAGISVTITQNALHLGQIVNFVKNYIPPPYRRDG